MKKPYLNISEAFDKQIIYKIISTIQKLFSA